jgi:hypothetical protein
MQCPLVAPAALPHETKVQRSNATGVSGLDFEMGLLVWVPQLTDY